MHFTERQDLEIKRALPGDASQIIEIAAKANLSAWSLADYISEIKNESSVFLVARERVSNNEESIGKDRINKITGFLVARLIMNDNNNLGQVSIKSNIDKQIIEAKEAKKESFFFENTSKRGEAEIYNLAVIESSKRLGIGSRLMEEFLNICRENDISDIFLEVRKSNFPAVCFYRKFGFRKIFTRKNYYLNPVEDADVMEFKF